MRKFNIKTQLMLVALTMLSFGAFAQTPQLFTPSGSVNGSTSSAGVGIGTTTPDAALGIKPGATLSFPALAIEATDAANTYSLYVEGLAGGAKHVQLSTGDANSRLSLKCASPTDKAPRLQMTSPNDVSANKAWAIFDYGSREVFLPDAKFKMRWMPGNASDPAIDMITSDGTTGLYLAPTVGNVGIGTDAPTEALEVAGNIKVSGVGNGIEFPDGSVQTTAGGGGGASALNDLTDVNVAGAAAGQYLQYSGSQWIATAASAGSDSDWTISGSNNQIYNTTDSVGIGTTFPQVPLQVTGRVGLESDNSFDLFNIHVNDLGQLEFNANDVTSNFQNILTLDDDMGWVGVTNNLNVGGTATADSVKANYGFISNAGSVTAGAGFGVGTLGSSRMMIDFNDIQSYAGVSTYTTMYLNWYGGDVNISGGDLFIDEDVAVNANEVLNANAGLVVDDSLVSNAEIVGNAGLDITGRADVTGGDLYINESFPFLYINRTGASGNPGIIMQDNGISDAWIWKDKGSDVLKFSASSSSNSGHLEITETGDVTMSGTLNVGAGELNVNGINVSTSLSLDVNGTSISVGSTTGDGISMGSAERLEDGGGFEISSNSDIRPSSNNIYDLGTATFRWDDVYATNGIIQTSDRRTKSNIEDLHYGLEEIMQLRPVSFEWKGREGMAERKLGLIAQEVQPILDEVVKEKDLKMNEEGEIVEVELERLGMYYADIIPVLINGMQEQQDIIEAQQDIIENQNDRVETLENILTDFGMMNNTVAPSNNDASSSVNDEQTRLFQNRPNPFDNTTVIPYFLADNVSGQIIVSDVRSGSPVATYDINGQGHGEITVEAGSLAAGAYTYALVVNGQKVAAKVMVLTR